MFFNLFFKANRDIQKAKQLLLATKKVIDYRKDTLQEKDLDQLYTLHRLLSSALKTVPTVDLTLISNLIEQLHACLTKHGGTLYPITFWSENAETFMVAAILALSVRAFFFQHYKIPTNSMYPTYAGMLPKVYSLESPKLTFEQKAIDFLISGATTYEVVSPITGVLSIPFFTETDMYSNLGRVHFEKVVGRKWFGLLPEIRRAYTLLIEDQPVTIHVPWDFCLDEVICQTFFPLAQSLDAVHCANIHQLKYDTVKKRLLLTTNRTLQAGTTLLNFQILTGDSLFVDRFTYNFRKPKVGEAFVFHTGKIAALSPGGTIQDEYYIKRIAGQGGDTLQIKNNILLRNGTPITGALAFDKNNQHIDLYTGYKAQGTLQKAAIDRVPLHHYYAMGDNSAHSADSRFWGYVPEAEVVGKPWLIFYPFKGRFGIAR